jgi:hypothetical protein
MTKIKTWLVGAVTALALVTSLTAAPSASAGSGDAEICFWNNINYNVLGGAVCLIRNIGFWSYHNFVGLDDKISSVAHGGLNTNVTCMVILYKGRDQSGAQATMNFNPGDDTFHESVLGQNLYHARHRTDLRDWLYDGGGSNMQDNISSEASFCKTL